MQDLKPSVLNFFEDNLGQHETGFLTIELDDVELQTIEKREILFIQIIFLEGDPIKRMVFVLRDPNTKINSLASNSRNDFISDTNQFSIDSAGLHLFSTDPSVIKKLEELVTFFRD